MAKFKKIVLGKAELQEIRKSYQAFYADQANHDGKPISLVEYLEQQDPSSEYPDCTLDAFERQLAARGIILSGPGSSKLEIMYDPDNRYLFPEVIERTVRQGLVAGVNSLSLPDIVATTTEIDAGVLMGMKFDFSTIAAGDVGKKRVTEGAKFPQVEITLDDRIIKLRKFGRMIKITSEARRRMTVDMLQITLRAIAQQWLLDMVADAIDVLQTSVSEVNSATAAAIVQADITKVLLELYPYDANVLVGNKTACLKVLSDTHVIDPLNNDYQKTGIWPAVMGCGLKRNDKTSLTDKVLAIDNRFALEQINERGSYLQEQDRIIDGQWDLITISTVTGFALLFGGAVKQLHYGSRT